MDQLKQKVSFTNEISRMMFGFGDSQMPNPDTVQLVESITLNQLKTIIREALKYSADGFTLKGEELVFLMRHNKIKMRRFVKYLHNKKLKSINPNALGEMSFEFEEKPKGYLMEFIEKIDETGELTDLSEIDETKRQRELRADRMSQVLDGEQYLEFSKARSTSFCSRHITMRNLDKLKTWVNPNENSKIVFKLEALEVLAYLAYQTVAEIVDYALLVRMDGKNSLQSSGGLHESNLNCAQRLGISNFDYSKIPITTNPITVGEIKEVMRRIGSPQAGLLNFGGKVPETYFCFAL